MRALSLACAAAMATVAAAQDVPDAIGKYPLPSWTSIVLFSVLIGFGLVQTFFGHRLLRLTLFAVGFLAAGGAILIPTLLYGDFPAAPWVGLGVGAAVGLGVGFTAARFPKLGVFLVGAAGGGALGFFLSAAVGVHIPINANASTAVLVVGGAAVVGALSLVLMRIIVILSTSILGAFCVMFGIGRLVPSNKFPNIFDLANELSANAGSLPKYVWGYLAGIAVLAALGAIVQFCVTAGKRKASAEKAGKEAKEADEWERLVHGTDGSTSTRSAAKAKDAAAAGKGSGNKASSKLRALLDDYSGSSTPAAPAGASAISTSTVQITSAGAAPRYTAAPSAPPAPDNPFRSGGASAPYMGGGADAGSAAAYASAEDWGSSSRGGGGGGGGKARNINF